MEGELLVVSGPRVSERFALGPNEVRIGRDPGSSIHLDEAGVAWDHCVVQLSAGRYRLLDRRTGDGTYVNGMRITEHWLEPGDHIAIGGSLLLYREDSTP